MKGRCRIVTGLVVRAGTNRGRHRHGLGAHEPGDPVHHVNAVAQPHTAAVIAAAVLRPAVGEVPVLGHVAHDGDQGSQLPGVQDFLRFDVHGQEVVGQTHHQLYVVGAGGCDHLVALLQRERHGLLDQYVLAGVERIHAQPMVQLVT